MPFHFRRKIFWDIQDKGVMFIKSLFHQYNLSLFYVLVLAQTANPHLKRESDEAKITKQKNWGFKAIYSDETKINDYKSLPKVKVAILDSGINKIIKI